MNVKLRRSKHAGLQAVALTLTLLLAAEPLVAQSDILQTDIRRDPVVKAVDAVLPSVVNIATTTLKRYVDFYDPIFQRYYGRQREELNSIGSGIIIDEEGDILTNLHVMQRATRAQVKLWDGRIYDVSNFIASAGSDLAVLKLVKKPGEKFRPIRFAPDDDLLLGETVIALGNPFGLGGSVSRGILSSKNRRRPSEDVAPDVQEWLQTDAAINPGNSGGPLINLRGELIGVNSAVGEGQGIGFAIPVKQVALALADVFSPEFSKEALWFGARVRPEGDALRIDSVQPGSPADKAGLRIGQQILRVDGKPVEGIVEFNRAIVSTKGRSATLQIRQGPETKEAKVQLVPFDDLIREKLGLVLVKQPPEAAATYRTEKGLFVQEVEKGGPADQVQIPKGSLLAAIDDKEVEDLMTAANVLSFKKPGTRVQLTVLAPRRINASFVEFFRGTVTVQVR
jgi:S1-C subfamily serine protease